MMHCVRSACSLMILKRFYFSIYKMRILTYNTYEQMVKEAMECEVTEVHTDTVARLKDTLLSQEQFQNLGTLFKMFSDPTRLKILSALFQEELCVCDLSELLEMTHSAVSHQLSVLRQNRLIKYRRSGKNIYYSLDDEHIQLIFDAGLSHIMEG